MSKSNGVLVAIFSNILSWFVQSFFPSYIPYLLPNIDEEDKETNGENDENNDQTRCIAIGRPGGKEQLRIITLKPGYVTCGYNVISNSTSPFYNIHDKNNGNGNDDPAAAAAAATKDSTKQTENKRPIYLPSKTVIVRIHAFSVNYADCAIRWGLYESANRFVGWPIVPGFDIAGTIEYVSDDHDVDGTGLQVGDEVFGATFFGAYSTRVLIPTNQIRKVPSGLTLSQAAALPTVSVTALYTLYLGGQFPSHECIPKDNRSILIHSAAGGVGSMLVQMSKLCGMFPVVGVVGRTEKINAAKSLGCDVVIDKSKQSLWDEALDAVVKEGSEGYSVIADANGISTLSKSFQHLVATGRLIVFGFHTNMPMDYDMLSPIQWSKMIYKILCMPKFDPMILTTSNKCVLGFNLSFFVTQIDMLSTLYNQIHIWLTEGKLRCPTINEINMEDIGTAHELIQSGKSIGKIVMMTKPKNNIDVKRTMEDDNKHDTNKKDN